MKKIVFALALFSLLFSVQVLAATYTQKGEVGKVMAAKLSFDRKCVAISLDARDETILNALIKKNDAIVNAFKARHEAIKNAYNLNTTAEINRAIIAAQSNFRNARNKANLEYQRAAKNAWLKFNTERKKCKGASSAPGEPTVNGQTLDFAL